MQGSHVSANRFGDLEGQDFSFGRLGAAARRRVQRRVPCALRRAFNAARERKTEAVDLFARLAAEAPVDPVVHFYLERLHAGEVGVEIKMTEK